MDQKFQEAVRSLKAMQPKPSLEEIERFVEEMLKSRGGDEENGIKVAIWTVFAYCTREEKLKEEVENCFENLEDENEFGENMAEVFEKYRHRIHSMISTIRWEYDEVVDISCDVAKNDHSVILGTSSNSSPPLAIVNLKLRSPGATNSSGNRLNLTFDEPQFHDFLWRLKEAQNVAKNLRK